MTTNSLVLFRSFPCSLVGVKTHPERAESRKSGPAQPAVAPPIPSSAQRPQAQVLSARTYGARPQQHQHQTTLPPAVASSPWIRALALARSNEQTLCLQSHDAFPLKIQTAASSTAEIIYTRAPGIPLCPEMYESFL